MAVTLTNSQLSAGLYSAFWNRAPDATGQNFWVGKLNGGETALSVATAFYNAPEGLAAYPNWIRSDNAALVTQVYNSVFEREPDPAGLAFYVAQLKAGTSFPQVVLNMMTNALNSAAAGNTDGLQFQNEIEVGVYVAEVLRTDDPSITSVALNGVTYEQSSVAIREAELAQMAAKTYTLTTKADNVQTTAVNDVIDGSLTAQGAVTFQSWDTIDGGDGFNTLNVETTGNTVAATLANIQVLNVQDSSAAGAVSTIALNGLDSLQTVGLNGQGAGSGFTLTNLGSLPEVTITGSAGANALSFTAAALQPAGQSLTVGLSGVTGAAGLTLSDTGANALETVNLVSTSAANNIGNLTTSGLGVTTLNVAGDQNLTLTVVDANSTLKTVNAQDLAGQLAAVVLADSTVTGGLGNDTITSGGGSLNNFSGGLGDDSFLFGGNPLVARTTVAGGEGSLDLISAATASFAAFTTAAPTTNISGIESIDLSTVMAGQTLTLSAIQAGIADVNVDAAGAGQTGTIVFDSGVAGNVDVGFGVSNGRVAASLGAFTVQSAGSGTSDSVTIDNDTNNLDLFVGNVTATGVETLTLDGTTLTAAAAQASLGSTIAMTASTGGTTTLNLIGNNSFTPGVITAGTINATGLTTDLTGAAAFLTMTAGANTATTILGSAGNDTLLDDNTAARAITIDGGAGNDTITTTGVQNDSLRGGEGNDTITSAQGNDFIDGGAGNDQVVFASGDLTANDTVSGGEGTADVLSYTSFVALTDDVVAAEAQVSNFEILRMAGAAAGGVQVTLSNYINNTGFTQIQLGTEAAGANGYSFVNASSSLNTISAIAAVAGTQVFDRLTDTAADTLTVRNATTGAGAATTITALTALDEETITLTEVAGTTAGANDLTVTTLTVADLRTLNISSASDVIVTNAIVGAANLATVDATAATGAVTINAANAGGAVTMTGNTNSTAITTFSGGAFADVITGGGGADVLVGNGGKDTISGGVGTDNITGGIGADNMTGNGGVDTFTQTNLTQSVATSATAFAGATLAAGDVLTFGNGVDVITDFVAGAGGDVLENGAAVVGAIATGIGQNVTTGFATATTDYFISGTWNGTTFTVAADGVGADTAIVFGDAAPTALAASQAIVILVGVDTDNLIAANFS